MEAAPEHEGTVGLSVLQQDHEWSAPYMPEGVCSWGRHRSRVPTSAGGLAGRMTVMQDPASLTLLLTVLILIVS